MKENLMLKKFQTETVNGTYEMNELRWFFGSKMMEIEDEIIIDNRTIQYSDVTETGYQFYDFDTQGSTESFKTPNLNNLKQNNHSIKLLQQSTVNKRNNTRWYLNIKMREILSDYIFYKIKERRTFKGLQQSNFKNNNINNAIKQYIRSNVIPRYKYSRIDFYVRYQSISQDQDVLSSVKLKFNPQFNTLIKESINLIENVNTQTDANRVSDLVINYNQTKPSTDNRFDYYFDLRFVKI